MLVKDYGVTLVLCTATQPALISRECFDPRHQLRGFTEHQVTEIIDDVQSLYNSLKRVKVNIPADLNSQQDWGDLSEEIVRHPAVLAIVNRRKDASDLYRLLQSGEDRGLFHLSGRMCAQHRSDVIAKIRKSLIEYEKGNLETIRVVSTQLVEAGVDLDFPVVYRAIAGLDSIAQAAGRCNREGKLEEGQVYVFMPPTGLPMGFLRQAASECQVLWKGLESIEDPYSCGFVSKILSQAILNKSRSGEYF